VGEWDAAITVTPGPGAQPQVSAGRRVGRLISGGRWLVTDLKNHTTGFEGHGVYGYNPAIQRYVATWVDDARASIHIGEGTWDPTSRTMTFLWNATRPNGEAVSWRETTQMTSDTEQLFRSLFPLPDGGEFEMIRATYRKL
jgi:hypothetical protein